MRAAVIWRAGMVVAVLVVGAGHQPAAAQSPSAPAQPPGAVAPTPAPTPQELGALSRMNQDSVIPRSLSPADRVGPPPARPAQPPVGTRIPAGTSAMPGSTALKPGTRPLRRSYRITCKRSTPTRWRCVAVDKKTRTVVRRCTARRLKAAQNACVRYVRQPPRTISLGGSADRLMANAARLTWNGWLGQTMSAVGKIYMTKPNGTGGVCSGTVVARNLVLTAGHCLTNSGAANPYVNFVPGHTWSNAADPSSISAPYGIWRTTSQHYWVPTGWLYGDDAALDWGLIEYGPDANGRYIGDYVGSWSITPSIRFGRGAHIYVVGYPHSGFWNTAQGYNGRGQYGCDTNWDAEGGYIGTGYELRTACYMNGGASGGPWFVQLGNGSWTIGGVSNRCLGPSIDAERYCQPYSDYLRSTYLEQRFVEFWNGVQPLLGR